MAGMPGKSVDRDGPDRARFGDSKRILDFGVAAGDEAAAGDVVVVGDEAGVEVGDCG